MISLVFWVGGAFPPAATAGGGGGGIAMRYWG